jgi:hypothetical protein
LAQPGNLDRIMTLRRCMAVAFADLPAPFREPVDYPDAGDRASFSSFSAVIDHWVATNNAELNRTLAALDRLDCKPMEAA